MARWPAAGFGDYRDSMGTALYCLDALTDYVLGVRDGALTRGELERCFDVPFNRVSRLLGKDPTILEVWEIAQWVRERDVRRHMGSDVNALRRMKKAGYAHAEPKPWFRGHLAMPLLDALRVEKYMKLRPFLKNAQLHVDRYDTDALSLLPLSALLGVMVRPAFLRQILTPYGWLAKNRGLGGLE